MLQNWRLRYRLRLRLLAASFGRFMAPKNNHPKKTARKSGNRWKFETRLKTNMFIHFSTWKWMVGIRSFHFGARPIFRGELLVLGKGNTPEN